MNPRKETGMGPTDIENTTDTGTNVKEESGNFSEDVTVGDQSENDYDEDYISDFEAWFYVSSTFAVKLQIAAIYQLSTSIV